MRLFTPRRLILTSFVLLVASMAVTTTVSRHAEVRWAEARSLGAELELVARAADHKRPVLVGEPVSGQAYEAYEQAFEALGDSPDADFQLFRRLREQGAPEVPAVRVAVVETYGQALVHLAEGARRTDGGQPVDWSEGASVAVPSLNLARHLADLAIADAERLLAEGDPEAATDRVLQALQLAGDLMRGPTWVAHAVGQAILTTAGKEPLLDRGLIDRLPPECLARLDEGLAQLDAGLPGFDIASAAEIALTVRAIEQAFERGDDLMGSLDSLDETWRHGFSQRLRCAELVDEVVDFRAIQGAVEELDWAEAEALLAAQPQQSDEGQLFLDPSLLRSLELGRRSSLANLRITRAAIAQRLTGEVPELPNPFGGSLTFTMLDTESGPALRIEAPGAGDPSSQGWPSFELSLAHD
ncbi:MAG: hypothetical protein P1V81_17250 [Planctomycetota bacterium]|nr:hypothetical protein [Planctomycetota bacterium]